MLSLAEIRNDCLCCDAGGQCYSSSCLLLQEIRRKEKALEASVKKPADAEKYQMETLAEAKRYVRDIAGVHVVWT